MKETVDETTTLLRKRKRGKRGDSILGTWNVRGVCPGKEEGVP